MRVEVGAPGMVTNITVEYHLSLLFMFRGLEDIVVGSSGRPQGTMHRTAGDTAKMAGARCRWLTPAHNKALFPFGHGSPLP